MSALFDRATTLESLLGALRRASRGRHHQPAVAAFLMDAEPRCLALQAALRLPLDHPACWRPSPMRTFPVLVPKPRWISVPPFVDRVVHHALCAELAPFLERYAIADSYACRPGLRARSFARTQPWALVADVARFFPSIPHDPLLALLRGRVPDPELCDRIAAVVRAFGVQGRGLPIGTLVSQHLANLALAPLDHWAKDERALRYVRYMDDMVVFGSRPALIALRPALCEVLGRLGLAPNERRTRVCPVADGVPFLGFRVFPGARPRLRPDRARALRRAARELERSVDFGQISEDELAARVASRVAHASAFGRPINLDPASGGQRAGAALSVLAAGEARRQLERERPERAVCQPRRQRSLQPQRQPPLSPGELDPLIAGLRRGPDARGPRTTGLCPGVDPGGVRRLASPLVRGTESSWPGDGLLRGGGRRAL